MKKTALAAIAALAFTAPAFAQDVPADDPGFNGFYVGASGGGAFQPNDAGSFQLFSRGGAPFSGSLSTAAGANAFSTGFCNGGATGVTNVNCGNDQDGAEYMARIGADAQFGRVVVGIVGEFGRAEVRDYNTSFSTTPAFYTLARDLRYNANIRGRVGFTPNNTTLFYAAGGPSYGRLRSYLATNNAANAFAVNTDKDVYGFNVGGGIEQRVGTNLSVGLEYNFTDLNDEDSNVRVTQGTAPATNPFVLGGASGTTIIRSDPRFRFHSFRGVINFRF